MKNDQVVAFLKQRVGLCQYFGDDLLARLVEQSRVVSYEPKEVVVEYGEDATSLGVLLDGELVASVPGQGGRRLPPERRPVWPHAQGRAARKDPGHQLRLVVAEIQLLRHYGCLTADARSRGAHRHRRYAPRPPGSQRGRHSRSAKGQLRR